MIKNLMHSRYILTDFKSLKHIFSYMISNDITPSSYIWSLVIRFALQVVDKLNRVHIDDYASIQTLLSTLEDRLPNKIKEFNTEVTLILAYFMGVISESEKKVEENKEDEENKLKENQLKEEKKDYEKSVRYVTSVYQKFEINTSMDEILYLYLTLLVNELDESNDELHVSCKNQLLEEYSIKISIEST